MKKEIGSESIHVPGNTHIKISVGLFKDNCEDLDKNGVAYLGVQFSASGLDGNVSFFGETTPQKLRLIGLMILESAENLQEIINERDKDAIH